MRTVTVMVGTDPYICNRMLNREYNQLVWASDSLETVAHYFEGAVVELTVRLIDSHRSSYVRSEKELRQLPNSSSYGWGVATIHYPDGANWYSFSREYLEEYLIDVKEIFPDLTPWQEEEEEDF